MAASKGLVSQNNATVKHLAIVLFTNIASACQPHIAVDFTPSIFYRSPVDQLKGSPKGTPWTGPILISVTLTRASHSPSA
jgi:hypothetical protein